MYRRKLGHELSLAQPQIGNAARSKLSIVGMWNLPPLELTLSKSDVHVWRANLDQPAGLIQQLAEILSADEVRRAERFYFEQDRVRFIVGRGLLRTILSRYLGIAANQLQFCYSSRGKPDLVQKLGGDRLRFNLSHSQGLVLYAVTRDRAIGIDVEHIRPIAEADQIVKSFFSDYEKTVYHNLPPHQKQAAFFNCWTRKEAFIKAIGEGLSLPLDQFNVSLTPGEPARLLKIKGDKASNQWSIQELTFDDNYASALVVEGNDWNLSCWEWQEKG